MVRDGLEARRGDGAARRHRPSRCRAPAPAARSASTCPTASSVTADEILCALGRTPRTDELGLESVGAKVDERGYVEVDDTGEVTSVPGQWLYAVGDVNGRNLLTHMGKYQGRVAGDLVGARAAGASTDGPGTTAWADHLGAPQVVFTDPEVASAGLTEARRASAAARSGSSTWPWTRSSGSGLQAEGYTGAARIVVDAGPGGARGDVRRPGRRRDGARRQRRRSGR